MFAVTGRPDLQPLRHVVTLRRTIPDLADQRNAALGQIGHQEAEQEVPLQLKHVAVVAAFIVTVPFDVQVQEPRLAWELLFRVPNSSNSLVAASSKPS